MSVYHKYLFGNVQYMHGMVQYPNNRLRCTVQCLRFLSIEGVVPLERKCIVKSRKQKNKFIRFGKMFSRFRLNHETNIWICPWSYATYMFIVLYPSSIRSFNITANRKVGCRACNSGLHPTRLRLLAKVGLRFIILYFTTGTSRHVREKFAVCDFNY